MRGGSNFIDITGKTFNKLTAVKYLGIINKRSYWECLCVCGSVKKIESDNLKSGKVKSCGCFRAKYIGGNSVGNATTHGLSNHKMYPVWNAMRSRCLNPNNERYGDYGGRGISICDRWLKFENFYKDMGDSYIEGLTIERKNTNGNYEPSNCKWDTRKVQARNTRSNKVITYKGVTATVAEMCETLGIDLRIVYRRLYDGWSVLDAIESPCMLSKINYSKRKQTA
jgi:hypothetical protein